MSIQNTPSIDQLRDILQLTSKRIAATFESEADRKSLHNLLITFANHAITPIVGQEELFLSSTPPNHPTSDPKELKNIQNSLQALTKAVMGLQKKPTTPAKMPPTQSPPSTYASKASLKPANPSLVITLSQLVSNPNFSQPRPVDICNTLNNALNVTPHNQVRVSALTSPLISKAFNDAYSGTVTPFTPPHTRANVKWSKILINGLPTGVSDSRGAFTPDECNSALASENPSYAPLIIAQKPSWVKPPHSLTAGLSSSLIVAFEDPDGSKARTLLGAKYLYAFDILKLPFSFDDPPADSVPAMTKPITRRQAALQSKATRGAKAKNKS
ncbi:hypothetical protein BGY98DRAFT_1100551 [Russula aff. rugulosa BPL654]|nr:hypothetical protein BGY98DRAFT_1100551 [Russula aff. rugulosa BPL654]